MRRHVTTRKGIIQHMEHLPFILHSFKQHQQQQQCEETKRTSTISQPANASKASSNKIALIYSEDSHAHTQTEKITEQNDGYTQHSDTHSSDSGQFTQPITAAAATKSVVISFPVTGSYRLLDPWGAPCTPPGALALLDPNRL